MSEQNTFIPLLLSLQEPSYGDFTHKLIPTLSRECILGVRVPILRKLAKKLAKEQPQEVAQFLKALPHYYYEENLLQGFLIEQEKDFQQLIQLTEAFLPYIDNWAVCDTFAPKLFLKYPEETYAYILKWLRSPHPYTLRYGIGLLLSNYLEEYYVNMMIAWYLATALAKQYEATLPLIAQRSLSPFIQNKTIQKARESKRIPQEVKESLLAYKI